MNYDLSIWIQYHDVHNKHQTIPISENCIFRASDRAIMYDDSNPLFPKVCVLGEKNGLATSTMAKYTTIKYRKSKI